MVIFKKILSLIFLKELQNFDFKMKPSIILERPTSAPPPGLIDPVRLMVIKMKNFISYIMKEMLDQMILQQKSNIMIITIH